MIIIRRVVVPAIAMVATTVVSACGSSPTTGSDSKESIVIGQAQAKSGYLKVFDEPVNRGLRLGVDRINRDGGIAGRQVKLITADTASDLGRAQSAAQQLLEKGAHFIVPPSDASLALPVARTVGARGVVALGGLGDPRFGFEGGGPLAYNVIAGVPTEAAALAEFAHGKGWRRAFLLEDQLNDYTKRFCAQFEQSWRALGGSVAGRESFQNSDEQISAQVASISAAKPDAVVVCSVPPGGVAAVRQIRAALPETVMLGAGAFEGDFWQASVPGLSDFYYEATVSLVQDAPALQETLAAYRSTFGQPPPSATFPAIGYSIIQAIKTAVERSGGATEGATVAKALNAFKATDLLVGPTTYSPTCHVPIGRTTPIVQIEGGKSRVLTTIVPSHVPDKTC